MSAEAVQKRKWTAAEYLAFERQAVEKHELHDGELYAMSGASRAHNRITVNLVSLLWNATRHGPCQPYAADLKLRVPATDDYCYPDCIVVCGPQQFEEVEQDVLLNPTVICEVLSPSTERYDRGEKFARYRTIATLADYLLLSQHKAAVEHFARQGDGSWLMRAATAGETIRLSIGCELLVDEIYLKVDFSVAAAGG